MIDTWPQGVSRYDITGMFFSLLNRMAEVDFQGQTVPSVWPFSEAKAITLQVSTLKGKDDGTCGPFAKLFRVTRYVDTVKEVKQHIVKLKHSAA